MSNAMQWKPAKSTGAAETTKEMFDGYARAGIELDEFSIGNMKDAEVDFKQAARWAKDAGVGIWSVHLPFCPFETVNPAAKDPEVRQRTIDIESRLLAKAGEVGIGVAVIHPSGEPNADCDRADMLAYSAETLAKLADIAEGYGVTLAVEDIPRTCLGNCASDMKRLLADSDKLRVCFDTNHLLIEKNVDFIRAVGDKIITLHVSDYDFRNERHWLPFEGKNDWVGIVTALEEVGYTGPFLYELGLKAPASIIRPRDLTYDDFMENYRACVSKVPGKVIGTPNMEVCDKQSYYQTPVI